MIVSKPKFTICMTMGRRPEDLAKTLGGLSDIIAEVPVIAINDFGDAETNEVFADLCPKGTRVDLGRQVGHHPAVDAMYERVETEYVFHMEDDWLFTRQDCFETALSLLGTDPAMTSVVFRETADVPLSDELRAKIRGVETPVGDYAILTDTHPDWFAYTFNPHIAPLSLWRDIGRFSQFRKEKHISRALRAEGRFAAFIEPGACAHIGFTSVSHKPPGWFKKFKNRVRGR